MVLPNKSYATAVNANIEKSILALRSQEKQPLYSLSSTLEQPEKYDPVYLTQL